MVVVQFSIVAYFVQVAQFTHTVICINKTNQVCISGFLN